MMAFAADQIEALTAKLLREHVRTRVRTRKVPSYIEGWHAIAEANRIFGYDAWDRQTMGVRCVNERSTPGGAHCAYSAHVRIRVRAGDVVVVRDGWGCGQGHAALIGEAHEMALKAAETDAMKRALSTFGNPFGLALYDPEQRNVEHPDAAAARLDGADEVGVPAVWRFIPLAARSPRHFADPVAFCASLRDALELLPTRAALDAVWRANAAMISRMRAHLPNLMTEAGSHYAEVLLAIYRNRRNSWESRPSLLAKRPDRGDLRRKGGNSAVSASGARSKRPVALSPSSFEQADDTRCGNARATPRRHQAKPSDARTSSMVTCSGKRRTVGRVDKAALRLAAPRRLRNSAHLRHVARQPYLVRDRKPAEAHHLTCVQPRALSRKSGDQWTVPLCRLHHRALHDAGDERAWWRRLDIDPAPDAERPWAESRSAEPLSVAGTRPRRGVSGARPRGGAGRRKQ